MGLTNTLRGALKWNAAEEASVRISAVRSQVERTAADSDHHHNSSGGHQGAGGGGSAAAENIQKQLRHGMSELDSIKQFLHDGINTGNRQFMDGGQKDAQLHSALEKGLQECEAVRQRLMNVMRNNNSSNTQGGGATTATARHKVEPADSGNSNGNNTTGIYGTTIKKGVRPQSGTTRKPLTGSALHNNSTSDGKKAFLGRSNSMTSMKQKAEQHQQQQSSGGAWGPQATKPATASKQLGPGGVRTRPQSATTASLRRAQQQQAATNQQQQQMPGRSANAWSENTNTAGTTSGGPVPQQPQSSNTTNASQGLKSSSNLKSRPSSAPNNRGIRQPASSQSAGTNNNSNNTGGPSSSSSSSSNSQQQNQQQGNNGNSSGGTNGDGATAWSKYQDWAQTVLNRVQNRRVQQHRSNSFRKSSSPAAEDGAGGQQQQNTTTPQHPYQQQQSSNNTTAQQQSQQSATTAANSSTSTKQAYGIRTTTIRPTSAKVQSSNNSNNFSINGTASGGSAVNLMRKANQRPQSATVQRSTASAATASGGGGVPPPAPPAQAKLSQQAQSLREQGNVLFQQRKYGESAECYSKAIACEPNSETLYCNRAAAYLMHCKFEEALKDSKKAVELDPGHIKAHWRSAKAFLYLGNSDQARHWYQLAAKLADSPNDSDAIAVELKAVDTVEKCRRCLRLREWNEALRCADQILEVFPPNGPCSIPWLCLKAEAMVHTDPQEAGAMLTRMAQEDPSFPEVWCLRAKALFYAGHDACSTNSALGYLKRAKELEPNHSKSIQLEQTIESFEKLRDEGNSAYAGGRWQEAYLAYTKCLTVDAYNSSLKAIILCNRAAVCIQCERWKDAMDDINQSIGFNPQNAKAYSRRARIHQHQNNHEAAVKDLQLAVQMYPSAENQERLNQAIELKNQAARQRQQHSQENAKFRYFNFANGQQQGPHGQGTQGGGTGGASRPSTAGTRRPGAQGPQRPQSATVKPAAERRPSHYQILGVEKRSDDRTITKAYREAALKWHPDKWATCTDTQKQHAEHMFKEVSGAYNCLKDPSKRRQYDLTI